MLMVTGSVKWLSRYCTTDVTAVLKPAGALFTLESYWTLITNGDATVAPPAGNEPPLVVPLAPAVLCVFVLIPAWLVSETASPSPLTSTVDGKPGSVATLSDDEPADRRSDCAAGIKSAHRSDRI